MTTTGAARRSTPREGPPTESAEGAQGAARPAIATARGLVKTYGRGEAAVRALDGVDVDVERPVDRDHGPVRVREVHAPALPRGARLPHGRDRRRRRRDRLRDERAPADAPAAHAAGVRLPVVQPRADAHGGGEHRAAARDRPAARRPGVVRPRGRRRGPAPPAGAPARRAVGRAAAAGRVRASDGVAARDRARGRADGEPRLARRRGGPGLPARVRGRPRPVRRDGHARPDRGVVRPPGALPRGRPPRDRAPRPHAPGGPRHAGLPHARCAGPAHAAPAATTAAAR